MFDKVPHGISSQSIGKDTVYKNATDANDNQYKDPHKKYYRDLAGILIESGINEIKKNLHPQKDEILIHNLDFTVNMIKRLDYHVEKIDEVTTDE